MAKQVKQEAQNPLILRCHRLMEAFAKADDERDFYLDRLEGFIVYVELDKTQEELDNLYRVLEEMGDRYCQIPKLTFYETKKIMEGFVNEKVYDIDTKEKLLDIIQSKEARENFLEFVYDHHSEFEKWQQYYQERSRIRIIEWLRNNNFHFVFEEDLDLTKAVVEKLKLNLFEAKVGKDILAARKALFSKAKTYYSSEALNPRPKRGRPPKQAIKLEIEPQMTGDFYLAVPPAIRPFLFTPDHGASTAFTFSSKFESEEALLASRRIPEKDRTVSIEDFQNKLASLRSLSSSFVKTDQGDKAVKKTPKIDWNDLDEEDDFSDDHSSADFSEAKKPSKSPSAKKTSVQTKAPVALLQQSKEKKLPVKSEKTAAKSSSSSKASLKKPAKPPVPAVKGRPKGSTKKKRIIMTKK